ncbi:hypothetical protein L226DRAFT_559809 [Lentinus tigrinus ALCF2SS1-7]|uniref:uncharacterized protein n=1 Tax=Lentinus tigrinus ALCF2SS1-7 TaxID=1328758 RepID=UPI0011661E41|nr:hypothetical protein L226DRAFT_559809 [Lentinus tigrinus ALCF2SS1-7]
MPNLLLSLQNILRRHNMDDRPHLSALMRKPANHACPVDEFRTHYELTLLWAYFKASYPNPPLLSLCRIATIKLVKKKNSSEHEYTLSYLTRDGRSWEASSSRVGILRCERTVSVHDNTTTAHTLGLLRSSSNGHHIKALDQVVILDPDASAGKDDDVVYTHHFDPSTAPSVSMLIAAATVLNEDSPNYLLLNRQCYWFAGLCFRLLVGRPADDLQANPKMRDQMVVAADGLKKVPCAGTFKHVFKLVTGEEIEQHCARLDDAFKEKILDIDAVLAPIKEDWEQRGRMVLELRELRERATGGSSGAAVGSGICESPAAYPLSPLVAWS